MAWAVKSVAGWPTMEQSISSFCLRQAPQSRPFKGSLTTSPLLAPSFAQLPVTLATRSSFNLRCLIARMNSLLYKASSMPRFL